MIRLVVNVNECSLYSRQLFNLDLESLSDIMGNFKSLITVHDNVNLNDVSRPAVVCADCVNLLDFGRMSHS